MSKKPTISTEAQVLLKLLRLALGTEPRHYFGEPVEPFPTNINWKEIIRLSYEHKVSALAVDGLKSSGYDIYNGLNEQQAKELKTIAEPWFNDVIKTEQSYNYYLQVLTTLCHIFKANGLTPIILKGYGLSLNYPIPSHRGCGDIDIFIIDSEGQPAAEKGDVVLRQFAKEHKFKGIAPHHTHFEFKGITVENHHKLSDPVRNTVEETVLLERLNETIVKEYKPTHQIDNAYEPKATYNAIYILLHIFVHFSDGKITLRQLVDYYTFLFTNSSNVDWIKVNTAINNAGLKSFFDGINGLLIRFFGIAKANLSPYYSENSFIEDSLINDMTSFTKNNFVGILNFNKYYRNRWHYKYFNNQSWLNLTINHTLNYVIGHCTKNKQSYYTLI